VRKEGKLLLAIIIAAIWAGVIFLLLNAAYKVIYRESIYNNMGPVLSYDGQFELYLENVSYDNVTYTSFHITDKVGGDIIFDCQELFETRTLDYITWKENTLDIIIMSSDTGFLTYRYFDQTWVKD